MTEKENIQATSSFQPAAASFQPLTAGNLTPMDNKPVPFIPLTNADLCENFDDCVSNELLFNTTLDAERRLALD